MRQRHDAEEKPGRVVNDPGHLQESTQEQVIFDKASAHLSSAALNILRRVHVIVAHRFGPDLVRYLSACGSSADLRIVSRALRFAVCQRQPRPIVSRSSRMPRAARLGSQLIMDVLCEPDSAGTQHMSQSMLGLPDNSTAPNSIAPNSTGATQLRETQLRPTQPQAQLSWAQMSWAQLSCRRTQLRPTHLRLKFASC